MDKEKTSQARPIFKQRTPEKELEYQKKWDEAAKAASENLKKGIYPNSKQKP